MEKDDLKSLVMQMYENLLESLDAQDCANKEHVVAYLRDAIDIVSHLDENQIDSIAHAKSAFNNAYKEIANKSISSYQHTNERFEKLSQIHEETLNNCTDENIINVPVLANKFHDIQLHMMDEVKKANEIISKLTSQVEKLEKESNIDSLTKVFNRRALGTFLNNICSKEDIPYELYIVMLDIDDFKIVNDTYGHIAGDKILIFIANILKKILREGDKVFRYGGEEFILILNRVDLEHCKKILSRIFELLEKNKLFYKGDSIHVTVSMGCTIIVNQDTPNSLLSRVDKALYQAKNEGKNTMRMELFDGN